MRRLAFTLIELLVVIAIIAILAAILFPVFAKARESAAKAATMTQMRQTATALILYASDQDDTLPQGLRPNRTTNGYWNTGGALIPPDWYTGGNYRPDECAEQWANAIQPYKGTYATFVGAGLPDARPLDPSVYAGAVKPFHKSSVTFNGLLSTYRLGSIANPSRLTMIWLGFGKNTDVGAAYVHPRLLCNGVGPCIFNPDGLCQQNASPGAGGRMDTWVQDKTMWVYFKGMPLIFSDTSAKFRRFGSRPGYYVANGNPNYDPFAVYDANGVPEEMWRCASQGATVYYSCFFRPDNRFDE
jgi:prepilin-type N-terminal cleavage/methylation domain-containing protein